MKSSTFPHSWSVTLLLVCALSASCAAIFHDSRQQVQFRGGPSGGVTRVSSPDGTFEVEDGQGVFVMTRSSSDIQLHVQCPDGKKKSVIAATRYTWELGWLNIFTYLIGFLDVFADKAYTVKPVELWYACPGGGAIVGKPVESHVAPARRAPPAAPPARADREPAVEAPPAKTAANVTRAESEQAAALSRLAEKKHHAGEYFAAAELFLTAARIDPSYPDYIYSAARCEDKAEKWVEAKRDYKRFMQTAPADHPRQGDAAKHLREVLNRR